MCIACETSLKLLFVCLFGFGGAFDYPTCHLGICGFNIPFELFVDRVTSFELLSPFNIAGIQFSFQHHVILVFNWDYRLLPNRKIILSSNINLLDYLVQLEYPFLCSFLVRRTLAFLHVFLLTTSYKYWNATNVSWELCAALTLNRFILSRLKSYL